ncbi:MAG: hypothetical protein FWH11_10235 [Micrococcales bacterium]|nr:hypothetical protein [Micrococcales bacterium]
MPLSSAADLPRQRTEPGGTPTLPRLPTQRPGPAVERGPRKPDRTRAVAAAVAVGLVAGFAVTTGTAWRAHSVRAAAEARVDRVVGVLAADSAAGAALTGQATSAAAAGARAAHLDAATSAVWQARSTLDSSPHVGDVPRAQLSAATDTLSTLLVQSRTSPYQIAQATAALATPLSGVVDAEAQWQAAEAARIAAEEQAAAAEAAQRVRTGGRGVRSGESVAPPPTPAVPTVPVGGKQCTAAGEGGSTASAAEIGDAINAYRVRDGLPALRVVTSGTLGSHAVTMANAGGIWHSGADNIVGCVSNGSASSLVVAWSRSAPHNAQMLRTDVTSVRVGGASRDGWLYGAAAFL